MAERDHGVGAVVPVRGRAAPRPVPLWIHEHCFEERGGQTLASDHVQYAVWGGRIVDRLLVRPDLERIFEYRRTVLREIFGSVG